MSLTPLLCDEIKFDMNVKLEDILNTPDDNDSLPKKKQKFLRLLL